jgi:hypothetical protein
MTLREIVDASLLAKAVPDEKTAKQNIDFLQDAAKKMDKSEQQKMQAVIDGMKKTNLFAKAQKDEEEQQQKQQQVKKPETNTQQTAQVGNTNVSAQPTSSGNTAQ